MIRPPAADIIAFVMIAFLLSAAAAALAAAAPAPGYDPRAAFAPFSMPSPASAVRGANGLPGPGYWQNRADYQIRATLDPAARRLTGKVTIRYTNHSPDRLDSLWLQLDQNAYRPDSRSHRAQGGAWAGTTDGMTIEAVTLESGAAPGVAVTPRITDTRMEVPLATPLAPGAALTLSIAYHYTVPGGFGGRTSWGPSKQGDIFDIAQWYPRMAVYDDLRGWDPLPYLAQEFYLDYGDFDYWITLPADMVVAGSGALQNPEQVLTAQQRARLAAAARSDATVAIIRPDEVATAAARPAGVTQRTWHFRMEQTRDVAFAASRAFAWDAARINLPKGGSALAMSVYPAEVADRAHWGRSTEYVKHAIEEFSRRWYPYRWPAAISVAGPTDGMEYPGIVFDGVEDKGKELFWITAHEIGHDWFPMMVGFDERRDAWMDEGFNTFIDVYESDAFNHGEFAPKRDSEYAEGGGNPVDEILPLLADLQAPPILSRADTITEKYRHPVSYFKSALGLVLLREEILGPERFDAAFRRFVAAWAFRHPKPADFFRAMEDGSGEDLSWWWRGWYATNSQLDLAVTGIAPAPAEGPAGWLVTVVNRDPLVMPATLRLRYADGSRRDVRLPAETWIRQAASPVFVPGATAPISAEIDPDHRLPDHDRSNNLLKR
ncbi:M1 family metallopeptidase [Sphingomonas morindae]|uniref:M1 family metallopeptidase n=1 Tax=Sphingomonas morindae TaxID=1541170 RepID=A0ABY4XB35_9SPHN|nr:M1 family metallopeptidase [Sphingomonas morindae]USI74122.1 M1 family metallopeptidase [Sphingomonas morindae]